MASVPRALHESNETLAQCFGCNVLFKKITFVKISNEFSNKLVDLYNPYNDVVFCLPIPNYMNGFLDTTTFF